ncbi:uncharacterized protein L199_003512 [Kwoniella botswanensis]|uniref:uncharacterized protein n=1 Tax=Kwoniella botswanensis TaxID=1268659 RepID=UPI00315D87B0
MPTSDPSSRSRSERFKDGCERAVAKYFPGSSSGQNYRKRSPFEYALKPYAQLNEITTLHYGGMANWTKPEQTITLTADSPDDVNEIEYVQVTSESTNDTICRLKMTDENDPKGSQLGEADVKISMKSVLKVDPVQFIRQTSEKGKRWYRPLGTSEREWNYKFENMSELEKSLPEFRGMVRSFKSGCNDWLGQVKIDLSNREDITRETKSFSMTAVKTIDSTDPIKLQFSVNEHTTDRTIPVVGQEVLTADFQVSNCQWR